MRRLEPSDALRIPLGLVMGWIGAVGLWKGIAAAALDPVAIIIAVLSVIFGVVFLAIAFVMVFGWLAGGAKKR